MVRNDLNTQSQRVTGCWPEKPLPRFTDPQSAKKDFTESFIPVWIGPQNFCKPVILDATSLSFLKRSFKLYSLLMILSKFSKLAHIWRIVLVLINKRTFALTI